MAQTIRFSIVVPLYKDNYKTLDRFLLHVSEQDYDNYEVIFVHNSPDDGSAKFMAKSKKLLRPLKGKYSEIDAGYKRYLASGNHSRAFNAGAAVATGDVLLFLDPDVYLNVGILREYAEAFEANPEAGFVYGDHDLEGAGRVHGRPYSEYELKCANYISGAFPIRTTAFKGWDEYLLSLQDWDMRLSAVDAGATGLYIDRPCFVSEAPTSSGISANSAANWEKRFAEVRAKHGFPVSKTAVFSLGAPYHATQAAEALGADTRVMSNIVNFKPHSYESLYLLGFYPAAWEGHMRLFYELGDLKGNLASKKRIIHWIGTDIFQMQHKLSWMAWQMVKGMLNDPEFSFVHLCECEATRLELEELGIKADVVPLPSKKSIKPSPLPEDFTVGVYVNPSQDMYFEEFMYEVARSMPDIKFKFFGNRNLKKVEDNLEWVGWVDMEEFLPTISAMVRLTRHDGLPMGPVEALMAGRNVLTSQPIAYGLEAKYVGGEPDRTDTVEKIRQLQEMPLNLAASEYWTEEVSVAKYQKRMKKYLK